MIINLKIFVIRIFSNENSGIFSFFIRDLIEREKNSVNTTYTSSFCYIDRKIPSLIVILNYNNEVSLLSKVCVCSKYEPFMYIYICTYEIPELQTVDRDHIGLPYCISMVERHYTNCTCNPHLLHNSNQQLIYVVLYSTRCLDELSFVVLGNYFPFCKRWASVRNK